MQWLPLAVAGLTLRGWARGHLERRIHLSQTGPYALLGLAFCLMTVDRPVRQPR